MGGRAQDSGGSQTNRSREAYALLALMSQGTKDAKINANDKALATFSEAIRLNPRAAAAFYERGKAYQIRAIMIERLPTTTKPFDSIQRTQAPLVHDAPLI